MNINGGGNVIKPVALKRTSSQVSTPLAVSSGLSNFSQISNVLASNASKKNVSKIGANSSEFDKENISSATFSFLTSQLQQHLGQTGEFVVNTPNQKQQQQQSNLLGINNYNSAAQQDNNIMFMQAQSLAQALLDQSSKGKLQQQQQQQQSSSSIEEQLIRELTLQLELAQQQNTPASSSPLMGHIQQDQQSFAHNSSPLLQFLSSEAIQTELFNQTNSYSLNNKLNMEIPSNLTSQKVTTTTTIVEDQEEATSPCLIKKRKVQKKNSKSSSQNLNEQKTEEMESECSDNNQNKEQGSSSSLQQQGQGQVDEIKLVQKKTASIQNKKGSKKAKKTNIEASIVQAVEEEQQQGDKNEQSLENIVEPRVESQQVIEEKSDSKEVVSDKELHCDEEVDEEECGKKCQENQDEIEDEEDDDQQESDKIQKSSISQQQQKLLLSIGENQGNGANKKTRVCNCKKTKCLKLYCDCFAAGEFCGGECNCCDCSNTVANKEARNKIVEGLLEKNPFAFNVKDIEIEEVSQLSLKAQKKLASKKGCNCRRSGCLKKYCQCYQDGLQCGEHCKCNGCENCEKPAKKLFLAEQNSLSLQSQASNSTHIGNNANALSGSLIGSSTLIPSLNKQNSISFNDIQNKSFQTSPTNTNQMSIQQNTNSTKINKSHSINNNQMGFNFNQGNGSFGSSNSNNSSSNNNNNNNSNTNNNSFNLIDENTQQMMITQLITNMVAQQTSLLNNPLIQLATLQASIQQTLMQQQQQQQQQQQSNSFDNSLESLLLQAAALAGSNSFKDTTRLSK